MGRQMLYLRTIFLGNGWQGECEESLMGGKRPIQIIQTLGIDLSGNKENRNERDRQSIFEEIMLQFNDDK